MSALLDPAEALARLLAAARRLPASWAPLEQAVGRVLLMPLKARADLPHLDVSAVDGFAVHGRGLKPGGILPLGGSIAAGHGPSRLRAGQARRILTGAPVPAGADRVVPQEWVRAAGGQASFRVIPPVGANIRRRGEELRRAALGLAPGLVLTAERIGFAASLGHARLRVPAWPRVAVVVSGDEIRPAGMPLRPGQIWDANGPLIMAWAAGQGLAVRRVRVGDQAAAVRRALATALQACDLLICSGGVSVGDRDALKPALASLGVRTLFWGVAQKPGKPLYAGRKGRCMVLGLPGNPAAAAFCLRAYATPLLDRLLGRPSPPWRTARAARAFVGDGRRTVYLKGRLSPSPAGLKAAPLGGQGSHRLASLAQADAWLEVPAGGLKRGAPLRVLGLDRP